MTSSGDRKITTLEFTLPHINPIYKGDHKSMLTERGEVISCQGNAIKLPWAISFLSTEVDILALSINKQKLSLWEALE